MRLGPAGPALHWRHLHQQGSAACSIFLQGFAGWGRMPLCCPLLLAALPPVHGPNREDEGREECWWEGRCLASHCHSFGPCNTTLSGLTMPKTCTGNRCAMGNG